MTHDQMLQKLAELNPEAVLFEPRDTYDKAVVAITLRPRDRWTRSEECWVAIYDYDLLVEATIEVLGVGSEDEADVIESAQEWVDFNMAGLWAGQGTPVVRSYDPEGGEDEDLEYEDEDEDQLEEIRPDDVLEN